MANLEEYLHDLEILLAEYQSIAEQGWNAYEKETAVSEHRRERAESAEASAQNYQRLFSDSELSRKEDSKRFTQQIDVLRTEKDGIIAEKEKALKSAETKVEQLQKEIISLTNQLYAKKASEVDKLTEDIKKLGKKAQIELLESQLEEKKRTIAQLEEENQKLKEKIETLQGECSQGTEIQSMLKDLQKTVQGWGTESEISKVVHSAYDELKKHIAVDAPQKKNDDSTEPMKNSQTSFRSNENQKSEPKKETSSNKQENPRPEPQKPTENDVFVFLNENVPSLFHYLDKETEKLFKYLEDADEVIPEFLGRKGKKIADAVEDDATDDKSSATSAPNLDDINEDSIFNFLKEHPDFLHTYLDDNIGMFRAGNSAFDIFKKAVLDNANKGGLERILEEVKADKLKKLFDHLDNFLN